VTGEISEEENLARLSAICVCGHNQAQHMDGVGSCSGCFTCGSFQPAEKVEEVRGADS
jgi:hypothetical protein